VQNVGGDLNELCDWYFRCC